MPENFISEFKSQEGEPEHIKQKIESLKNDFKELSLEKSKEKDSQMFNLSYKFNKLLPGNQKIWIPQRISLFSGPSNIILVSKGEGNLRYLLEKYLNQKLKILPISFAPKELLNFWNYLKKRFENEGHIIILQRIILNDTYFESSLVKELNFKAKNAEDVDLFDELIKNAKKIIVITFQIKWNLLDEDSQKIKPMTVRMSHIGSVLIYGDHPNNRIQLMINLFDTILKEKKINF